MSQLLEYQHELNSKFDKEKVEAAIDSVLKSIERRIEDKPTQNYYYALYWYPNGKAPTERENFFSTFSGEELRYIQSYFKEMGFEVKIATSDNYGRIARELQLSW